MKINIKLTKELNEIILRDLERRHPFAYERVGFAYAKIGYSTEDLVIIIVYDYQPIDDADYIKDYNSGAKINAAAIRKSMQRILDKKEGCFHVHLHNFSAKPRLSRTDKAGIFPLIPGFQVVSSESYHGIFLLGNNGATIYVWPPKSKVPIFASKISIIGYPMKIINHP